MSLRDKEEGKTITKGKISKRYQEIQMIIKKKKTKLSGIPLCFAIAIICQS